MALRSYPTVAIWVAKADAFDNISHDRLTRRMLQDTWLGHMRLDSPAEPLPAGS